MIRAAKDYAADLKLVENAKSNLQSVKDILEAVPQIGVEFEDPTVSLEKKHLVIDRVFPKEIRNFLKVLCDNGDFGLLDEIEQAYMELTKTPEKVEAQAELTYVTPPTTEQMERIRLFLAKECNNPDIKIVAVEPDESPVLSTGKGGPHKIQGIGAGFVPEVLNTKVYDEVMRIKGEDAFATARVFTHSEGLFIGISSGAALHAAVALSQRPENKGKTIVALLPDTGDRYLSTPLVND